MERCSFFATKKGQPFAFCSMMDRDFGSVVKDFPRVDLFGGLKIQKLMLDLCRRFFGMEILNQLSLEVIGKKSLRVKNLFFIESFPMKSPSHLDFTPEQVEQLISRLENKCLEQEDYPLLIDLIMAIVWLNISLKEKDLSIRRLRSIFGIKTETAKKLLKLADKKSNPDSSDKEKVGKKKGSGHRAASEYSEAKIIRVAHQVLKKGETCPSCLKGRLFNLSPGSVIRIIGTPWLQVEIYKPERLRCSLCGRTFTANLPEELMKGSRGDHTAKAIVSLMKYRGGVPFYRQEQLQKILGTPISASEIWKMTGDLSDDLLPVYAVMCAQAAKGKLIQNDDTKARVLSVMAEREKKKGTSKEDQRKGTFTTGILSTLQASDVQVALFFTGRQHAGENLADLLERRPEELPTPIQQCDGGSNSPKGHKTQLSNCLAHARRKFCDLVEAWPEISVKIIAWFSEVFANEKTGPTDPEKRLRWHQEKSKLVMETMRDYCNRLIDKKEVEPNSSMGRAIAYMNNHWEGLTLFLKVPGVPLTNNATERLLKRAVLNRKNSYFYLNEYGAKIGDTLMSTIETCVLNQVNPWKYLVAIQEHQEKVRKDPELWVPWEYEKEIEKLHPP